MVTASATEIEREYPVLWAARPPGLKAMTALPLMMEGRVVGALGVHFGVTRVVEPAEQAFLTALAGLCAHASTGRWRTTACAPVRPATASSRATDAT